MEKTEKLFRQKSFVKHYDDKGAEFALFEFGYEDFNYIEGADVFRKQSFYTLHYVLKGEGRLDFQGREYAPSAGDFFVLPPNASFRYVPDEVNPWKYFWFCFSGIKAAYFYDALTAGRGNVIPLSDENSVNALFEIFRRKGVENLSYFDANAFFYSVLGEFLSYETYKKEFSFRENALNCINLNYLNCDFSVSLLCRLTHISRSYLYKIFPSGSGATIKKYITDLRMKEAVRLLSETDLPVKSVAYSSGFSDEINFMKAFKKKYGVTPSEMKKKSGNRV